jgi:hypothetical protein
MGVGVGRSDGALRLDLQGLHVVDIPKIDVSTQITVKLLVGMRNGV